MRKILINKVEDYSVKALRCFQQDKIFFLPKSAVHVVEENFVLIDDWLTPMSEDKEIDFETVSLFDIMKKDLLPKQKYLTGVDYIYNKKCFEVQNQAIKYCVARKFALIYLWTGAGKTFIYLSIIKELNKDKNILVVPSNLVKQMNSEIDKHFPELKDKVKIIKYSSLSLHKIEDISDIDADTVIIFDEIHRLKNCISFNEPNLASVALHMANHAGYVYGGSATPSPNGNHDLLGVMRVLHEELRDLSKNLLVKRYCKIKNNRITSIKNIVDFFEYVSPYIFYKDRENYEELLFTEEKIAISLPADIKENYIQLFKEKNKSIETTLIMSMQLMRRCLYEATEGGTHKIKELLRILEDIEGQVIIFIDTVKSQQNELEQVVGALGESNCAFITGGIKTLDSFIDGSKKYLIASYGSGSEGLNLQFCSTIIFYGHNFNYATKLQAMGRIRRYGQKETCKYYSIYTKGTVEEAFIRSLERKEDSTKIYSSALSKENENKILKGEDICV